MVGTTLHWVDGPWPGRLALAARPRGGEWLEDEMTYWRASGADTVVSLLEAEEQGEVGLDRERMVTLERGMDFRSLPIADRQVPIAAGFTDALEELDRELRRGRNIVLHCRQGVGRTGLVAACLLLLQGFSSETALRRLIEARGVTMPETAEQREWIEQFAGRLASAR